MFSDSVENNLAFKMVKSDITRSTTAADPRHLKVRVGYQSNQKLLHCHHHSKNQGQFTIHY